MRIILPTIVLTTICCFAFAQQKNIYPIPKKYQNSFYLIDTSKINFLNSKEFPLLQNNKPNTFLVFDNMPCKRDFVNIASIPNACNNITKIDAVPIPNACLIRIKIFSQKIQNAITWNTNTSKLPNASEILRMHNFSCWRGYPKKYLLEQNTIKAD